MMKYKRIIGVGVVGYGTYTPLYRIKVSEIAAVHGVDGKNIEKNLGVSEKSVAGWDEDTVTMAYMASKKALDLSGVSAERVGALYIGSESHPYAVKPTSTIVGEALGIGNSYMAADLEFACKAGTAGMQMVASHVVSGVIAYGMAIGADRAQASPKDVLEYTAAAGSAAILLGKRRVLARMEGFISFTSDTSDFWRRSGQKYPSHAGRFTGEPAYFRHVVESTKSYLKNACLKLKDIDHVVFHMPNGKFPRRVAKRLGFSEKQMRLGFVVSEIGNSYSASSLMGLCRVFEKAKVGERVLLTSYGSGAGSDSFSFVMTPRLRETKRKSGQFLRLPLEHLNYGEYRVLTD